MDTPIPQVSLLRPTTQKEFVDLIDAMHIFKTQDVAKRWLDYMAREFDSLSRLLVPKVIEDIKDINYVRGIMAGLCMVSEWSSKLQKQRERQIEEEAKADTKKKEEAKKKNALFKKQAERKEAVKKIIDKADKKLKGGKING